MLLCIYFETRVCFCESYIGIWNAANKVLNNCKSKAATKVSTIPDSVMVHGHLIISIYLLTPQVLESGYRDEEARQDWAHATA